jgi:hypothetical protein
MVWALEEDRRRNGATEANQLDHWMNILRDADLLQNNDAIAKNELTLQIKLLIRNLSFDDPIPAEQ